MSSRVSQKQAARVVRDELAREKARTRRLYVSIGVVVVLILAGLGGWAVYSSQRTDTTNAAVPAHASSDKSGLVVGSGPATIDVYLDFMCPLCGEFEKTAGDAVNQLVTDGKAKLVYHPLSFLDPASSGTRYSTRAAGAAGCASDAGKLQEFVKIMYATQPKEGSEGLTNSQIIAFAAAAGITDSNFATCVNNEKYKDWTALVAEAGTNRKVTGTPTVFVNGKQVTATAEAITKAVG